MNLDIRKVHEELYVNLTKIQDQNREFTFSLRKSNRAGKLEQGFWFYGTERYLSVSFWSGMDWKNRSPNIYFLILSNGKSYLEICVSDSDKKREFIENFFLSNSALNVHPAGKRYIKEYFEFEGNYLAAFERFIDKDKQLIDEIVERNQDFFRDSKEDEISFISIDEFTASKDKVESYRTSIEEGTENTFQKSLIGFQIKNFGPIINTGFMRIPRNAQWVFLIGENGTGKTSFLRAIASGLCYTKIKNEDDLYIKLELEDGNNEISYERTGNSDTNKRKPIISGFCSYGAARLKTNNQYRARFSFIKALNKNGLTSSLFNVDTVLIDIQEQLNYWRRNPKMLDIADKRKEYIREVLIDLLPNVYNIKFSEQENWENTLYIEKDNDDNELPPVTFDKLASGLKSLIAMIGDMMMRLFNQQPSVTDPSELTGIVLIDEIDIHLHPNLQKYLVEQLTKTFPKVQFIATSHSPIPLLGAPINSHFFKVERNSQSGVELTDLTEIGIHRLLPNAILTSDLFGMNSLFTREYNADDIRTEDSMREIELNDITKETLKEIANRLRNQP